MLSCHRKRGYICKAPGYAEPKLDDGICACCIADGSAHKNFDATFVDSEAFPDGTPDAGLQLLAIETAAPLEWQRDGVSQARRHCEHSQRLSRTRRPVHEPRRRPNRISISAASLLHRPALSVAHSILRKQQGRAGALAGSPTPWSGLLKLFRYRRRSSPPVVNYFLDRVCVFPSTAGHAPGQRIEESAFIGG